jgi:hypothetical protein
VFHALLVRKLKFTFSFFESIIVPMVLRKGLSNIIELEVLLPMSMITKST